MTTLNKLTEQVRRLYARSQVKQEDIKPLVEEREIKLLVVQATHEILSMETKEAVKYGDISIPTCMIATYTDQSVTGLQATLPAYPIKLPQDIGVWSVSPHPTGSAYIPITSATWDLLENLDEGLLEDAVGYYVEGRAIHFTKAPSATVKIKLLIVDPSQIGDNDPYPIPPEYEAVIIERVMQLITQPRKEEQPKG